MNALLRLAFAGGDHSFGPGACWGNLPVSPNPLPWSPRTGRFATSPRPSPLIGRPRSVDDASPRDRAHPDDEVLGMGGTIALHVDRGDVVRLLVVTDGSSTQYPGDDASAAAEGGGGAGAPRASSGSRTTSTSTCPDMRLDTLAHVEVNRVVEEHVRENGARGRVHRPARREP